MNTYTSHSQLVVIATLHTTTVIIVVLCSSERLSMSLNLIVNDTELMVYGQCSFTVAARHKHVTLCRFFKTYFLDACLELTSDPVANVRLHLASLLPALKQSIRSALFVKPAYYFSKCLLVPIHKSYRIQSELCKLCMLYLTPQLPAPQTVHQVSSASHACSLQSVS